MTPAIHTWIGPNNGTWSQPLNWAGSSAPVAGEVGAQLIFNASSTSSIDNIAGLTVDSIAFNANHSVTLATPLNLNGAGFAQIEGTSTTTVFTGAAINLSDTLPPILNTGLTGLMVIQCNLTGTQGLQTMGAGTVRLTGVATYPGTTFVNSGVLELSNAANANNTLPASLILVGDASGASLTAELRLGSSNQISDAASVVISQDGHFNLNGKLEGVGPLSIFSGRITTGTGLLTLLGDVTSQEGLANTSSEIVGSIDLGGANRTFIVVESDGSALSHLIINGAISGTGGVILNGGAGGTLEFAGSSGSPNSYLGNTNVNSGTLLLNAAGNDEAIPGDLFIGDGTGAAGTAVVRLLQNAQINDAIASNEVRINGDGRFELNGFADSIRDLTLRGGQVATVT